MRGPNFNLSNDHGEYVSSPDLMLFWGFNESSGSVVEDLSGNNYHANLAATLLKGGILPYCLLKTDGYFLGEQCRGRGCCKY